MPHPDRPIAADANVERLRHFIADGHYKSGDRLPPERDLTDRLGVSRTQLRKALGALEREGIVWRHVGKGTFVSTPAEQSVGDDLVSLGRRLTPFRMMRARLVIEPAIAREAAINASGDDLLNMRRAMERTRAATTWAIYEEQDDLLHQHIAHASRQSALGVVVRPFECGAQGRCLGQCGAVNTTSAPKPSQLCRTRSNR